MNDDNLQPLVAPNYAPDQGNRTAETATGVALRVTAVNVHARSDA